ncbi:type II secretion system F family protein [Glycocaulis sp.]|uniref:type II secretion system F family protein n=1 Tax=Glycocaulis sp. TaxID=1969725 RepID=UPI003D1AF5A7
MGDLSFIIAAIAAFVAVAGVGIAFTSGGNKRQAQRVQIAVGAPLQAGRRQTSALDQTAQKKRQVQETLKELEERQKAARKRAVTLRAKLEQAGVSWTPQHFWIGSAVIGVVAAFAVFLSGMNVLITLSAGFVAGFGLPRWVVGFLVSRRQKNFTNNFADAIDIVVRGVKSGLPLNECLKIIARESPEPVRTEFEKLNEGIAVGVDLDEGMRRMTQRMPVPELNFFAIVLVIQAKTGGNLAEALGNLSTVLRARKLMGEKIQALSSEAKASAMIIGALPPLVLCIVMVVAPDYMSLMFTHPLGQLMLLVGLVWMAIGIFVMRGMINFKH